MFLKMKNHAFWHNQTPYFFYGGEMHYFRLPPERWADQLARLGDLGLSTVSTYVPWLWHEPEPGQFDFSGKTHPQRNLLNFLSMAQDAGLSVFLRVGPYVMAELRQEGLPPWLFTRYPDILAQTPGGDIHPARMATYLNPTFLDLVDRWYARLASAVSPYFCTQGGPIILTQLDNEVGMLHWVTRLPDSRDDVVNAYRTFLTANDQQPSYWAYGSFWREYRAQYLQHLYDQAHSLGFPGPYVINVHGFRDFSIYSRGVDYPVGLSQLAGAKVVPTSLLGGDFYPGHVTYDNFHDIALAVAFTRSVNSPNCAAFSPEFQSGRFQDRPHIEPSDLDLSARVSIAYGLNGLNWYMVSSGENPQDIGVFGPAHDWQAPLAMDGSLRPQAQAIAHLGKLLKDFGPTLAQTEPVPDVTIGFYSPYYMTENPAPDTEKEKAAILDTIVRERETLHFDGIYRCLVAAGINLDALWLDDPDKKHNEALDTLKHPWLWVATTRFMDPNTQLRLASYAQAGGTLIIGPYVPDQDLFGQPCRILADTLDIPLPLSPGRPGVVRVLPEDSHFCSTCVPFPPVPGSTVLGYVESRDSEPTPVIIRRAASQGEVIVFGIGLSGTYDTSYPVLRRLLQSLGKDLAVENSNPAVHAVRRVGSQGHFLFVHNFHETVQHTRITVHDAENGSAVWTLSLSGRQGLMLPYGGVPLIPNRLHILQSTAELSRTEDTVTIYPSSTEGFVKLQWLGDIRPEFVSLTEGTMVGMRERIVTIQWESQEHSRPIHIRCHWPRN